MRSRSFEGLILLAECDDDARDHQLTYSQQTWIDQQRQRSRF